MTCSVRVPEELTDWDFSVAKVADPLQEVVRIVKVMKHNSKMV